MVCLRDMSVDTLHKGDTEDDDDDDDNNNNDIILYTLTTVGLSPGGSTHLHTNNTQKNTNNNRTTQITNNVEGRGPCPFFASFTLAFALQLRKKH
jgi:hypothetical protein